MVSLVLSDRGAIVILAADTTVVVGGLGYVGLALAVEFTKYFCPIRYDFRGQDRDLPMES